MSWKINDSVPNMGTYYDLDREFKASSNQPPLTSMARTYSYTNIKHWVLYPTCTKYGYMHIINKDMHDNGSFIISLENMLSHVNVCNAHNVEHIRVKDSINIKNDHN